MKKKRPVKKQWDGGHLFRELIKAMKRHPLYLAPDDDLSTTEGVLQTAIYFIDRMSDDFSSLKNKRICP